MTKNGNSPYTVRLGSPVNDEALRKFALDVSNVLTTLGKVASTVKVVQGAAVQGTTSSWALALYDEVTGTLAFLPGVRFVPVGADDVNVGFEIDVSPRIGTGTNGTSQGYMANYGTVAGSKLAAGISANNEDPNIPRVDLGFKSNRGATLEMYGNDGAAGASARKGQLRATLGPGGILMVYRYIPTNTVSKWEVIAGFGPDGELLCGYRGGSWPTSLPNAVNVHSAPTGVDTTSTLVASIDKAGVIAGTKLTLNHGTGHSITLDPAAATSALTFTLQQKYFVNSAGVVDAAPTWVLCAAT